MAAAFIIDCSMTMAWCFADEATPATSKVLDRLATEAAAVPSHWFLEVTNVLAMAERRKRISAADSTHFLSLLTSLDIEMDGEAPGRAFDHLLPLCRAQGLTSYQAAYLDLALRRRLPLASLDADLRSAAKKAGVAVLSA